MCSCNCVLSSNSPIGKVELLNQSDPLNHKLHFSSLVGGIPLVPVSKILQTTHKVPVHVRSQLLNLCHSISYKRLPSSRFGLQPCQCDLGIRPRKGLGNWQD
ncbi:hypothetical protein TNCV_2660791 [Trichonephila clavipes]|nr:hypothetical protein TNCV_2660791 [Trichonephila clavipes]